MRARWQAPKPLHELLLVKMGSGASYSVSSGGTRGRDGQQVAPPTGRTPSPTLCLCGTSQTPRRLSISIGAVPSFGAEHGKQQMPNNVCW